MQEGRCSLSLFGKVEETGRCPPGDISLDKAKGKGLNGYKAK